VIAQAREHSVLIIDDEAGPRESLRYLLKDKYRVHCATSVDDGVAYLREHGPDLIIMDIRMPGKTGIEGLREIRAIDPFVSVVMLTGFGALETAQEALRLGANDYQTKPFDMTEMRDTVARYVRRTMMERRRAGMLRELESMNVNLHEHLTETEQLRRITDTTSEFAHDLRNPLTIVGGYVELLSKRIEESRGDLADDFTTTMDYLDVIGENVRRCCELSRLWEEFRHGKTPDFEDVSMWEVVQHLRKSIEPLAGTMGVTIDYDLQCRDVRVNGLRAQLIRALHNVVANAVQAVDPRDGTVRVIARATEDAVEIVVEDNGCGMTPDVQERIYEPYFTTKPEGEGTGLGMVITRRIVDEHGGRIDLQSTPGFGTIFTIRLPLAPAGAAAFG
jgi:signal transduction histidine kinase